MSRLKSTFQLLILVLICASYNACDLINPEEKIPAFIRIDSISLATVSGEGPADANIVDAWVFENEQLVGVYELPATVPILKDGETPIRISAGIKMNGQVGSRIQYLFTEDFQSNIELFPDSEIHVNPTVTFKDGVTFKWLEDFENAGLSLEATSFSEREVIRIEGSEAYDGRSAGLFLDADEDRFECRTGNAFDFSDGGSAIMLEITYKCNHPFFVGLFSRYAGGTLQTRILGLYPSEDWNRVYMNLTDVVSSSASFIDHRPYFGFIRDEGFEGEIEIYLDNIRLIH